MKGFKWQWIVKILLFAPLFVLVFVGGTQWLWNHLAVDLFNAPHITFVETIGLMLLGRLITGGFHKGPGSHKWQGEGFSGPPWKRARQMREKWYKMTPEEREEFKKKWADCGPSWGGEKKAENTPPTIE